MEITLNITEDSKVELVKDNCEAVQGESNVTILKVNFPSTIKGYSIDNYTKQIEFGECKELGECIKFYDILEGDTYKLCDTCTQFEKLLVQFTLKNLVDEDEPIVWKTTPFMLEFCESINAENTKEVQTTLLSLAEIKDEWETELNTTKDEWETFVKTNAMRVIYKVGDVPTANADVLGDTIFYLGANSTSPYVLTYGHYYRCTYTNEKYEWTDLTVDPSLADVANGVREINNSKTMQFWIGTAAELENEVIQENVVYIPEDHDIKISFDEVLTEMANNENYKLAYPFKYENGVIKFKNVVIPQKKVLWENSLGLDVTDVATVELDETIEEGDFLEVTYSARSGNGAETRKFRVKYYDNIYNGSYWLNMYGGVNFGTSPYIIRGSIHIEADKKTLTLSKGFVERFNGETEETSFVYYKITKVIE